MKVNYKSLLPAVVVLACLLAAGVATLAPGAEPLPQQQQQSPPSPAIKLPPEVRVTAGECVRITADIAGIGKSVAWIALDDGLCIVPATTSKETNVLACKSGRYRLKAITCAGDQLSEWASTTVVVTAAVNTPQQQSPSGMTPAPAPATATVNGHLVVIEETSQRTPAQAVMLSDPDLSRYVKQKGWRVHIADQNVVDAWGKPPVDLAPYIARAQQSRRPLPYLIQVDDRGNIRYESPLSATPTAAELLAALKKAG